MMRNGKTKPDAKVIQFVDQLVSELDLLDPDEKIKLIATGTDTVFSVKKTGRILAEMHD